MPAFAFAPTTMSHAALSPLLPRDARRIARHVAQADAARFLHPAQQALLHRRGWLAMLAPREHGGAELPLPQAVRLEEAVAAVDGSTGWALTLCAGAGWFAGFLAPDLARSVISTRRVCLAGSGAPAGRAEQEGAGYRITGSWEYASGAPMASHFTLNAVLHADGQPLLDAAGAPRIRAFIVPAAMVTVTPSWRSIGMHASGTHSFQIAQQWVHASHGFAIESSAATSASPLYRYPFDALAYVTLAANLAGMARHFISLAEPSMARRRHAASGLPLLQLPHAVALLQQHDAALAAARASFYAMLDQSWAMVAAGALLDAGQREAIRQGALALCACAREAVDQLYPYCGLQAAREDSDINRVWRDFHTASQHPLLLP